MERATDKCDLKRQRVEEEKKNKKGNEMMGMREETGEGFPFLLKKESIRKKQNIPLKNSRPVKLNVTLRLTLIFPKVERGFLLFFSFSFYFSCLIWG